MPTEEFVCEVEASLEAVWRFHDTIETLFRLTPPHTKARLEGEPSPMTQGVIYRLKMRRMGIPLPEWQAEIVAYAPPSLFIDRQVSGKGPFRSWTHEHRFEAITETRTRIIDRVTYEPPFGVLGRIADALFLRADIRRLFAYRHKVTKEAFATKAS